MSDPFAAKLGEQLWAELTLKQTLPVSRDQLRALVLRLDPTSFTRGDGAALEALLDAIVEPGGGQVAAAEQVPLGRLQKLLGEALAATRTRAAVPTTPTRPAAAAAAAPSTPSAAPSATASQSSTAAAAASAAAALFGRNKSRDLTPAQTQHLRDVFSKHAQVGKGGDGGKCRLFP